MTDYLDRLRQIGASERLVEGERDGWILVAARWPDRVRAWMPGKLAQLDDPRVVRLYRILSEILDTDAGDDARLEEAADIMADLAEQAYASGEIDLGAGARRPAVRGPRRRQDPKNVGTDVENPWRAPSQR